MSINFSNDKSIYLQIEQMIEDDILRDILIEEEKVPSTNELARIYNINPATAAKGINLLVDENILYKKRGIGMFVSSGGKQKIINKRKQNFYKDFVIPLANEARNLNITQDELIEMIKQLKKGEIS